MARAKKTASAPSTAPKTRGIDLQEVEARVTALDKAKRRSYDIFDIEQRVYNLEKNGGTPGPSPSAEYTIELGTAVKGASVTLVKDAFYLFTTVYNTGLFTNASVTLGKGGSVYIEDQIGRMICAIKANDTAVSFSGSGDVSPNIYVPIVIKKNGEVVQSFAYGDASFTSGKSITVVKDAIYVIVTTKDEKTFTGAEVLGHFDMEISESYADTTVYVVKATDTSISFGGNTIYANRVIGGDVFV